MGSHQPSEGSSLLDATCALGESPVNINTALEWPALSLPQVSYANVYEGNTPPFFIVKGLSMCKNRVADGMSYDSYLKLW